MKKNDILNALVGCANDLLIISQLTGLNIRSIKTEIPNGECFSTKIDEATQKSFEDFGGETIITDGKLNPNINFTIIFNNLENWESKTVQANDNTVKYANSCAMGDWNKNPDATMECIKKISEYITNLRDDCQKQLS